ncbi:oxidoreductase, partial [Staphylococcus pseudintermedius]
VFDIRKHEMAQRADEFYQPYPGTDLVWLSAVTKYIIYQGWHAQSFIDELVYHFDEYYQTLEPYTMDFADEQTGISKERLIHLANEILSVYSVSICWAM